MDSVVPRMPDEGGAVYPADFGKVIWTMRLDQEKKSLGSVSYLEYI